MAPHHLDAAGRGGTATDPRELGCIQLDCGYDRYRRQRRQAVANAAPVSHQPPHNPKIPAAPGARSLEHEGWHFARDVRLGEDAQRYANRNGVPVFALLRTIVMNLSRLGGSQSIQAGMQAVVHDFTALLAMALR